MGEYYSLSSLILILCKYLRKGPILLRQALDKGMASRRTSMATSAAGFCIWSKYKAAASGQLILKWTFLIQLQKAKVKGCSEFFSPEIHPFLEITGVSYRYNTKRRFKSNRSLQQVGNKSTGRVGLTSRAYEGRSIQESPIQPLPRRQDIRSAKYPAGISNTHPALDFSGISMQLNHTISNSHVISTAGALRIGSPGDFRPPSNHPLIAFEHLSLYIQKNLGQSVAECGSLDHGGGGQQWTTMGNNGCW